MKTKNIYQFLEISPEADTETIHQAVSEKLLDCFFFNIHDIDSVYEAYFILTHPKAKQHYDNLFYDRESEEYKPDYLEQIKRSELKAEEIKQARGSIIIKNMAENPFITFSFSWLMASFIEIPSGNSMNEDTKTALSVVLLVLGCVLLPFFHVVGCLSFLAGIVMKVKIVLHSIKEDLMKMNLKRRT